MNLLRYLSIYLLAVVAIASLLAGGWWTFTLPVVVYAVLPVIELVSPGTTRNLAEEDERAALQRRAYDAVLYGTIPVVYGVLAVFLVHATTGGYAGWSLLGAVLTTGLIAGALGINVAHELGHRSGRLPQLAARALLLPTLYLHFVIEHNRGHHSRVATDDDPASSRRGEWLYSFWIRSVVGGWRSAWALERARVERTGRATYGPANEMVRFVVIETGVIALIAALASPAVAALFVVTALIGALHLETVNYVEHYGLRRSVDDRGRPERVRPHHSWNSNHSVGRALLFELTRHSDHHAHPMRPYPVLRHFDEAPQLPTGYPGMIVLATMPPLFFAVMNRRVDALAS